MNKARFEAIEAERVNDPAKFANWANAYWVEALPVLRAYLQDQAIVQHSRAEVGKVAEPSAQANPKITKADLNRELPKKAEAKEPVFLDNGAPNKKHKAKK